MNGGLLKKNMALNKPIKLKILFVLILSNASMALFMSGNEQLNKPQRPQQYVREGYITLKVKAVLKTKLETSVPVTITDKKHNFIIRDAFILEKISTPHDDLIEQINTQYIIEIKQSDFPKLSLMSEKYIYPYQLTFPKFNRSTYEILF